MSDEDHMRRAIALSFEMMRSGKGGPFGAVVVKDGRIVAEGSNQVTSNLDPTAHAEVVAIRRACQALQTFDLTGCEIYTSCEPCPMCLASAMWARLDRVVFAADRDDAAKGGFDDRAFYELFAQDRDTWATPRVLEIALPDRSAPFDTWLSLTDRTDY